MNFKDTVRLTGNQYAYITGFNRRHAYSTFGGLPTLPVLRKWIKDKQESLADMRMRCLDVSDQQEAAAKISEVNHEL